ncbi:MAG: YlxR family protein [Candidatus Binatia bacterium]
MGKGKGHRPIRTCISCGAKRSKGELIRLVVNGEGQLVRDDQGKRPGRGAYVCKSRSCREQLSKNRRLGRRFRTGKAITISPDLWAE